MTLEQLRVFVAVAERQHVTRAAVALNVAQSAVSAAIAALEARHDVELFHRVGRGIQLTEAGTLFLVEARALLARAEAAGLVLSELGNSKRGTLAVQASQTIAGYWLPRHLVAFRHKYPGIDIRLTIANTAQVAAAVHEGAADLGFIEGMIEDPMLTKERVARDQMVIVVGAEHAWSTIDRLEPERLIETDWVLREPGSGTRSTFEAALQGFGVSPGTLRLALELPSNEALRAAVEAGLGATVISASVAAPSLEAGLLHRVRFNLPERDFQVVRHVARRLSRAADALLSMVRVRSRGVTDIPKLATAKDGHDAGGGSGRAERAVAFPAKRLQRNTRTGGETDFRISRRPNSRLATASWTIQEKLRVYPAPRRSGGRC